MPTTIVAPTTAIRMPGMRLLPLSSRITARVPAPTVNVIQLAMPFRIEAAMAHKSATGPTPSILNPNSLGSWLINTVSAMPFM
jgi:hypothetical protein